MKKHDKLYLWLAIFFALLFWVPLLNVFLFLPLAIYFSIKQIRLIKKRPREYNGLLASYICLGWACLSLVISIVVLIMSLTGKISFS